MKPLLITVVIIGLFNLKLSGQSFNEVSSNFGATDEISFQDEYNGAARFRNFISFSKDGFFNSNESVTLPGIPPVDYYSVYLNAKFGDINIFQRISAKDTLYFYKIDKPTKTAILMHKFNILGYGFIQSFQNNILVCCTIRSNDDGNTWADFSLPLQYTGYGPGSYYDSANGFLKVFEGLQDREGSLYHVSNNNKTLTKISPTGMPDDFVKNINSLTAISKTFLYAKSSGKLYASTNGGINWILVEDDYTYTGTPISRVNDSTAFRWIFTRPTPQTIQFELVRTRNRERAACVVDFPMTLGEIPRHMDCVNDSVCFVVTSQGQNYKLWKTTNGGGACKRVLWDSTGTGMAQHSLPELGLSLYPNPSRDVFYAALSEPTAGPVSYSVMAIDGRMIMQHTITPQQYDAGGKLITLDMSGYAHGLYLLQLTTPHAQTVQKLMLQR